MSRLFTEDGTSVPVTIISVAGNTVASIQNQQKCGYSSVTLSKNHFEKRKHNRPLNEFFKKTLMENGFQKNSLNHLSDKQYTKLY